jgi:hypothetical protein
MIPEEPGVPGIREEVTVAEAESARRGSAAELLGNCRAAERDLVAARETADVAELAAVAAEEALVAARETGEAARLATEASQRAERSALRTSEAAAATARAARKEQAASAESLRQSEAAEEAAGDAFHEAEREGFPKTSG